MKDQRRSGNPAKRSQAAALAAAARNERFKQTQLAQAFAAGFGSLIESGFRITNPQGLDVTESLAQELGVEVPAKPAAEADHVAGRLTVISGGKVNEVDVPAKAAA